MIKNKLKEIRLGTFLMDNQEDFAEMLNINPQQYNRYEKQIKQPQLETAIIITDNINQLLKNKGIKKKYSVESIFYRVE